MHETGSEDKISCEKEREREQQRRGGQLLGSEELTSKGRRWHGRTPLLLKPHYGSSREGSLLSKYRAHLLTM